MSTVKISELSSSANITSDDFFPVVDSLVTKKASAELMKNFVLGKSGSNDTVHISSSNAIKFSATGGLDILADTTITGSLSTDSNKMEFDGNVDINGNMTITGSLTISGSSTFTNIGPAVFNGPISTTHPITGSISGSINNAVSSSFANTASVANSITFTPPTASYAVTASYALSGGGGSVSISSTRVDTLEATTSTSYTDLTTVGPTVTLMTGTEALVTMDANVYSAGSGFTALLSVEVSGATTLAASDANSTRASSPSPGFVVCLSRTFKISGLTPGLNTFTLKYRCDGGGPWSFNNRSLTVQAL